MVVVFFWAKYCVGCDSDKNETSDVQRNGPTENAENDLWFIYIYIYITNLKMHSYVI